MKMFREDGIVSKGDNTVSRDKYFVVIGVSDNSVWVETVIINTEINTNFYNKIAPFQHQLKAGDYDFFVAKIDT